MLVNNSIFGGRQKSLKIKSNETLKFAADCLNDAEYYCTCPHCGKIMENETFSDEGTASGSHTFSQDYSGNIVTQTPTCQRVGLKQYVCSVCGEKGDTYQYSDVTSHDYSKTKTITSATCANSGTGQYVCSVCGAVGSTYTIPATGNHNYGNYVSEANIATSDTIWTETVTDNGILYEWDGYFYKSCSNCGKRDPSGTTFYSKGSEEVW